VQSSLFNYPCNAQAGDDAIEVDIILIAGVADELKGAMGWKGRQNFCEGFLVEVPCG
jgi:hypothetical protein